MADAEAEVEPTPTPDGRGDEDWVAAVESSPFARCATCKNAGDINMETGALMCGRYNMFVNAEADEIPDDCPEYDHDPNKPLPPEPVETG